MSREGGGDFHSWLDVILCLLSNSKCTCYWGTALLLFALLPHSSHKVNCWNDLYLRKTSETLKSWQYRQHGETTNTHSMSDSILWLIFVVEQWKSPRDGIRLCDVSASQSIKYCWILASHWTVWMKCLSEYKKQLLRKVFMSNKNSSKTKDRYLMSKNTMKK